MNRSRNKGLQRECLPVELDARRVGLLVGRLVEIGKEFADPVYESMISDAACRIIKSARSDRVLKILLLERIHAGFRTPADLIDTTKLDRRKISRLLTALIADNRLELKLISPSGPKGGRPSTSYWLTKSGENYLVDTLQRLSVIGTTL